MKPNTSTDQRTLRRLVFALYIILFFSSRINAQTVSREYQIKAVFLFNFAQFVEWPPAAFASAQAPLVIGVYGKNPFGSYLQQSVAGEKVNGHPVVIQQCNNPDDIKNCNILFINQAEAASEQVSNAVKGKRILSVSDGPVSFLQHGGMIRFFNSNNKIQIQVNLEATQAANILLSSKLLRLAQIFVPEKNK